MSTTPNVLLFLPDGMQAAPLASDHICQTPGFDRLVRTGIQFRNAYTPTPVCSPARASLMTGLLAHNHGVLQVEHTVDADQSVLRTEKPHWAQRLSDKGYRTGYFGKWHIERSLRLQDFGWDVNGAQGGNLFNRATKHCVDPEPDHLDPDLTSYRSERLGYQALLHYGVTDVPVEQRSVSVPVDLATEFLDEAAKSSRPWCCCVSFPMPNEAMICSRGSFDLYPRDDIELPANLHDRFSTGPALYRRAQEVWADVSEDSWRMARACYYARITEIDRQFSRLIAQLQQSGQLESTIIIVASDHGKYVGAHGFDAHNFGPFEEIYNIPLIISGPGIPQGATTEARVGLHDLCPTLLDLVDAEPIPSADSRSFASVLADPTGESDRFTSGYAEYHGTRYPLMQRICWDETWKFVFNGFDYDELYNLHDDPAEMNNLAVQPAYQERIVAMTRMMWRRINETHDNTLLTAHYYSVRFAAVGPEA